MAPLAPNETTVEVRDAPPAHFLIKIESYSLLDENGIVKYETGEFEAGDCKWKLIIYPNGHKTTRSDGESYVSVYLAIANKTAKPAYWEVNVAAFSICLYNQISDHYRYTIARTRRYHAMKTEWGFSEFISKKDLTDPSNGFLANDNCVFGAEVFVSKNKAVIECLSLKNGNVARTHNREFKIPNFSSLRGAWTSEEFTAGDCEWEIKVYPNGNGESTGRSASIFLKHVASDNPPNKVKASYTVTLKNQESDERHVKFTSTHWFSGDSWGWPSFVKLASLNDPNGGFIVKDCVLVEIDLSTVQAIVT